MEKLEEENMTMMICMWKYATVKQIWKWYEIDKKFNMSKCLPG